MGCDFGLEWTGFIETRFEGRFLILLDSWSDGAGATRRRQLSGCGIVPQRPKGDPTSAPSRYRSLFSHAACGR